MLQKKTQEFDQMSLAEKSEVIKALLVCPALSAIVFFRRDIGARLLAPRIGIMCVLLMFACAFIPTYDQPAHLFFFALTGLFLGTHQRFQRWREFRKRVPHHSFYIGTSSFSLGPRVPGFIRHGRLCERLLEPALLILGGLFIKPASPALGGWLVFAGFCVIILEATVQQRTVARQMDMVDGLVDSGVQGETVEEFSPRTNTIPSQQEGAAIPTGLGADIAGRVKTRKLKRRFFFWKR